MLPVRIIARLDIKGPRLIKGIHLEGWRSVGDPNEYSRKYYHDGIDEILYIDVVASLYSRDLLLDIIRTTTRDVFVPLTVGGGIRTIDDAYEILRAGADKVAVNTGAIKRHELIRDISKRFGRQCMVSSIQAKKIREGMWEAYIDSGREPTGIDVIAWAQEAVALGAGELLITSIDQEGSRKGFDLDLLRAVSSMVTVPVIASGGFGSVGDFVNAVYVGGVDAVAIADGFHYERTTPEHIRVVAEAHNIPVRHR